MRNGMVSDRLNDMRLVLFLTALMTAPVAAAQDYQSAPAVNARRAGDGGEAYASMDVRAPPAAVWSVLADCSQARRYMARLISCRILERGEGWEVREHRVRGWPLRPALRNVSRLDFTPNRLLTFAAIEGDWTRSYGEWRLTPIDGGHGTRVEYRLDAALAGGLPPSLSQASLIDTVRRTLVALRRESERARTQASAASTGAGSQN